MPSDPRLPRRMVAAGCLVVIAAVALLPVYAFGRSGQDFPGTGIGEQMLALAITAAMGTGPAGLLGVQVAAVAAAVILAALVTALVQALRDRWTWTAGALGTALVLVVLHQAVVPSLIASDMNQGAADLDFAQRLGMAEGAPVSWSTLYGFWVVAGLLAVLTAYSARQARAERRRTKEQTGG